LVPATQHWVDDIFSQIGVKRVPRQYDGENALCCGGILLAQQRFEQAEKMQQQNLDDMVDAGAMACVFNCPFCFFTLGEAVLQRGLMPILMSELCRLALGERPAKW
jgi:heterodisulfide reductase subunit B